MQVRLSDKEKLGAHDWIREHRSQVQQMTAMELASHLQPVVGRPITSEVARHAAKVCDIALAYTVRHRGTDSAELALPLIYELLLRIAQNEQSGLLYMQHLAELRQIIEHK